MEYVSPLGGLLFVEKSSWELAAGRERWLGGTRLERESLDYLPYVRTRWESTGYELHILSRDRGSRERNSRFT